MLRTFFTLALLPVSFAVDAAYIKASVALIGDGLSSLETPGSVRQMAINALLKSVEGAEKLTPAHNASLENIVGMLEGIIGEINGRVVDYREELTNKNGELSACNTKDDDIDLEKKGDWDRDQDKYVEDRYAREGAFTTMKADCQALVTQTGIMKSSGAGGIQSGNQVSEGCVDKDKSRANYLDGLTTIANWFDSNSEDWVTNRNACKNPHETFVQSVADSNSALENALISGCAWQQHRDSLCPDRSGCYDDAFATTGSLLLAKENAVGVFDGEVKALNYVVCLLNSLRFDTDVADCPTDSLAGSDLALNFDASNWTAKAACAASVFTVGLEADLIADYLGSDSIPDSSPVSCPR